MLPKVYIIIVTWNSSKHITNLFLSLKDMDYPKSDWNIVVVDNNSSDGTINKLRQWQHKMMNFDTIIQNKKNTGFSGGNNIGIEYALKHGADYVALLNDDVIVEPNWLNNIIEPMEADQEVGLCQPLLTRYPEVHRINNFGNAYQFTGFGYSVGEGRRDKEFFTQFEQEKYEPAYNSFSTVVIRKQVLEQIGLMDQFYFMYHEDTDFCFRARLQGWKLLATRSAVVHHNYKFPSKKNKIRYFWLEKNRFYLMLKFFKLKTLILILPAMLVMETGLVLFSIYRGFFGYRVKAYIWVLANLRTILKNRREIQVKRKFGDKKLYQFMTGIIDFQEVNNPLLKYIGNPLMNFYFKIVKARVD